MTRFDVIWGMVTRVVSFLLGVAIMAYETLADKSDRPWLYAAAIGLMGLPVARAAEDVLGKFTGQGPASRLPEKQPEEGS
jgi:peptidoglycan/LPS O-acetylase OafA/YrhL